MKQSLPRQALLHWSTQPSLHLPTINFAVTRTLHYAPLCISIEPVFVLSITLAVGKLPTSPLALLPAVLGCCTFTPAKSLLKEPVSVDASTWKEELLGKVTSTAPVLVENS